VDALAAIDRVRAELDVLEHPFYQRWSAGLLSAEDLARYAQQYRHAVVALADASALAASLAGADHAPALREHAREERGHVALWDRFARAAGARERPGEMLAQTRACAEAWRAGEHVLEHLAVLYAIEAGQPAVSRTKLEGLVGHYGYSPHDGAVEYFAVHAVRDREHARHARVLIARLLARSENAGFTPARLIERARVALAGNWRLLDGVAARA
jgi:pyrroloquinoline-quinone synthase